MWCSIGPFWNLSWLLFSQDKAQPEAQAQSFGDLGFNALSADDPSAISLVKQPGSDGFRLDSDPLSQVCLHLNFISCQQHTYV